MIIQPEIQGEIDGPAIVSVATATRSTPNSAHHIS